MIPLNHVDRIEVIKGVSDPRYGNVLGGVVNLVTRKPTETPQTQAQVSYGSYATIGMNAYHAWKPGAFDYLFSADHTESDGYLRNGDYRLQNVEFQAGYDFDWSGRLSAGVNYLKVKKGLQLSQGCGRRKLQR